MEYSRIIAPLYVRGGNDLNSIAAALRSHLIKLFPARTARIIGIWSDWLLLQEALQAFI